MKKYKPLLIESYWTKQDSAEYAIFESYIKKIDYGNKLTEFGIPSILKDKIDFIKNLATETGFKISDLFKMFLDKTVFKIFQFIKWNLHELFNLLKQGYDHYRNLQKTIAEYIHVHLHGEHLKVGAWTKDKLHDLDNFLKNHPHTKHIAGIAVSALLLYMWFTMSFTGDFLDDFDISMILHSFAGHFSLAEIFGTPEGTKLLILFATGALTSLTFPWPSSNIVKFAIAIITTLGRKLHHKLTKGKENIEDLT